MRVGHMGNHIIWTTTYDTDYIYDYYGLQNINYVTLSKKLRFFDNFKYHMGEWHMIWVYHSKKKRKTQVANALGFCLFSTCEAYAGNLGILSGLKFRLQIFLAQNFELLNRKVIILSFKIGNCYIIQW